MKYPLFLNQNKSDLVALFQEKHNIIKVKITKPELTTYIIGMLGLLRFLSLRVDVLYIQKVVE